MQERACTDCLPKSAASSSASSGGSRACAHTFTLLEELRAAAGLSLGKLCRKARVTELAYLDLQRGENPARDKRVTRKVLAVLRQHDPNPPGAGAQALSRTATPAAPHGDSLLRAGQPGFSGEG